MSSWRQQRPPRSPAEKENRAGEAHGGVNKRLKSASGLPGGRPPRPALSTANSEALPAEAPAQIEFQTREDVENLLNEKMKGKNKNDFKGKAEQMSEYIKKLRFCISFLLKREDENLSEIVRFRTELQSTQQQNSEIVFELESRLEAQSTMNEELRTKVATLEEGLKNEEADKMVAIKACEAEREAKIAVETNRDALSSDLVKAEMEGKKLNDQIKMLQDNNKRLQEYNSSLQQYNSDLQAEVARLIDDISKLQTEKSGMLEMISAAKDHAQTLSNQLDIVKSSEQHNSKENEKLMKEVDSLHYELKQIREDRNQLSTQMQKLESQIIEYQEQTRSKSELLDSATTRTETLEETISSQREDIKKLQTQLAAANDKLKRADLTAGEVLAEVEEQKSKLEDLQNRLLDAEQQIVEGEKLRKKLHNTILELKGNIRVFCRVRPLLANGDGDTNVVSYPTNVENLGRGIELLHNAQKYNFTFDKVFDQAASQEDIFIEISQLVQSALDGYKVSIFAYGQTGSGKTYTMMGKPEAPDQKGLIPRSLEQIFETSQSLSSQGWKYKMQASMLEIYNETIRDLLLVNRQVNQDTASSKYTIRHDANGNTYVSDLTIVDVCSINEVSFLLRQAAQSRSVGRTQMNEESSRSHFVFTLRIFGINEGTDQQVKGVLNLIDLAGSERLSRSGATNDRLKETQAINKSLSCLSDVIFSIAKKEEHVPFRNSKLTYLLQPCLGGDSKTLMFVNLSPELSSSGESICSLRFAARVNSCEIGVPRRETGQTQVRASDSRLSCG